MSIYSSLYAGVSGLTALGNSMSVIGDNIANVNTTGFKGSRATFQDILNTTVTTGNGTTQVGQGTVLSDVSSAFSQAGFETTDSITDLAIDGEGFFVVRPEGTTQQLFTRAGAFTINEVNALVNSAGMTVQGYKLDAESGARVGTFADITLDSTIAPPIKTSQVTLLANLDSTETKSASTVELNARWDATDADGDGKIILETDYTHSATIKVYDVQGNSHDVTIYFDKAFDGIANKWDFIVTTNPEEDMAKLGDATAGVLASGFIQFTNDGKISDIQMGADGPATIEGSGEYLTFSANFFDTNEANAMSVELDFGAKWNGTAWVSDTLATTQFASTSVNMFQSANGFARGEIQDMKIDEYGVISGVYSNGKTIPLYQIAMARFNNNQGLDKLGGNVFRETVDSGPPAINPPQTNGLGKLISSSLEQSTVDIAVEFVKMITTQRGYQANSKTIMTTDQMIQTVVNLKR
ncbi:flagellar hook-basal body protein [Candidatus Magnetomorum sp. HK-1]|nr:flagellar hook-basal body protein [Candidatus Magnetomorum sp. HK-1]